VKHAIPQNGIARGLSISVIYGLEFIRIGYNDAEPEIVSVRAA
jgi:hypothetical protein